LGRVPGFPACVSDGLNEHELRHTSRLTEGVYAVIVLTCALVPNIVKECAKHGVQVVLSTEWDWTDDDTP
jgi:hypothetical protein